jgi:hypothetical protein
MSFIDTTITKLFPTSFTDFIYKKKPQKDNNGLDPDITDIPKTDFDQLDPDITEIPKTDFDPINPDDQIDPEIIKEETTVWETIGYIIGLIIIIGLLIGAWMIFNTIMSVVIAACIIFVISAIIYALK